MELTYLIIFIAVILVEFILGETKLLEANSTVKAVFNIFVEIGKKILPEKFKKFFSK